MVADWYAGKQQPGEAVSRRAGTDAEATNGDRERRTAGKTRTKRERHSDKCAGTAPIICGGDGVVGDIIR